MLILLLAMWGRVAFAEDSRSRLDGIPVEALEVFPSAKSHELSLDVGIYPFNPYYTGFSVGGGYTFHFGSAFGWEVVHANQFFSVDKGLTAELADRYQVNPQQIEMLRYLFSSDFQYVFANGKLAFLEDHVRYFRGALLLGPGLIETSARSAFAACFGARFEFFTGETFSWKVEVRDGLGFGGADNILTFALGSGVRF
jgi:hypothetical protein